MKRTLLALSLIFIITGAVLSVAAVYVPAIVDAAWKRQLALGGLFIMVDELSEKPQSYFVLTNPDSYFLQAISSPEKSVLVGDWGKTQIDDEIRAHNNGSSSGNVEFNSHYYAIGLGSATPAPPEERALIPILYAGYILWVASLIAAAIVLLYRKRSNKAKP